MLTYESGSGFGYVFELDEDYVFEFAEDVKTETYISALEEVSGVPRSSADQDLQSYAEAAFLLVPDAEKVLDVSYEINDPEGRRYLVVFALGSRLNYC